MIRLWALLLLIISPSVSLAQLVTEELEEEEPDSFRQQATAAPGATLRWLDKMVGATSDVQLLVGQTAAGGAIQITLEECRFPNGNPSGDAYARLTIQNRLDGSVVFAGWMFASAPALNAMDHPRYDVWVLRCKTS